jgi:CDP-diacylglycerol--glycerol-3-phosphate 3-phosphatidyltransferase/cardiolipin synthase
MPARERGSFTVAAGCAKRRVQMLTLPNLLTLSRIFAVPFLVFLLWYPEWRLGYALAFVLYCLVGITDYFDGYLARAQGTVSKLGIFLDPIADKIMVAAVIVMLISTEGGPEEHPIVSGWHVIAALVILLREIAVSGLREFLAQLSVSVPVSKLAKWKTTFQMVALGALILAGAAPAQPWVHQIGIASLWAAAVLTVITGWDYMRVGMKHMD